jgi:2-polyprenyl-3-methyl-5-hydroxy-6-metoxy-1,4-benzoquinol methylase
MKAISKAWSHSVYAENQNVHPIEPILKAMKAHRGDSIADFGCGDGLTVEILRDKGYDAIGYDMVKVWEDTIVCPIEDIRDEVTYDFGICLGVLDHVPEAKIADVITNMRRLVKNDIYFTIPIRDLGYNALIGRTVQTTIKPIGWWRNQLMLLGQVRITQEGEWMTAHVR